MSSTLTVEKIITHHTQEKPLLPKRKERKIERKTETEKEVKTAETKKEKKQKAQPRIKIGYRVGKLVVTEPTRERKNGYTIWRCTCGCGNTINLDTRCLQRETVKDCGCESKVRPGQKDLSGRRFGKLVCMKPSEERDSSGSVMWECKCDCGNFFLASATRLLNGTTKSCGCLFRPPLKDWAGKRFGMLTVAEYAGKQDGKHRWKCRCDCGNEVIVDQGALQNGHTKSCGCMQQRAILDNLKLVDGTSVTKLEHALKGAKNSRNTSGYNGVYQNKSGRWAAQITFKGKTYYLGAYDRIEDAVKARERGEEMYDEFVEWYYSTRDIADEG